MLIPPDGKVFVEVTEKQGKLSYCTIVATSRESEFKIGQQVATTKKVETVTIQGEERHVVREENIDFHYEAHQ